MNEGAAIEIRSCCVGYGAAQVLHDIDLDIAEGEFVVLVGPSGCGKSTLLNTIAGFVDHSQGELVINGRDVSGVPPKDRGLGMVFQSYALYPHMTARQNLGFALKVAGVPRTEIANRVDQVARLLQLLPVLDQRPGALSGGQRQRIAIGRALVRDAAVYLFDEPLSNLDALLRNELRVELKRLHQSLRKTMVYVTHDQVEAMTLADRLVVLNQGRVQQIGTPLEVFTKPANRFVAQFIGAPAMNFIDASVLRDASGALLELPIGRLPWHAPDAAAASADGVRDVVLGIRPEHVALARDGSGWPATVTLTEPMGSQTLVWVRCSGIELSSLQPPHLGFAAGQPVALQLDTRFCSLFDRASGLRVGE
jgi:multiple sugar transport system ATP-binding protein